MEKIPFNRIRRVAIFLDGLGRRRQEERLTLLREETCINNANIVMYSYIVKSLEMKMKCPVLHGTSLSSLIW